MKRSFLKSYLRFGFPSIAVIVSNNLNKHMETSNDLIDFYFNGVYNFEDNSLINIDEGKCNADLFGKLFLIFASLDFKEKNKDHIPFGLIQHFTKTLILVGNPFVKYYFKYFKNFLVRTKEEEFYVLCKKEELLFKEINDLIISLVYGPEKINSDYV